MSVGCDARTPKKLAKKARKMVFDSRLKLDWQGLSDNNDMGAGKAFQRKAQDDGVVLEMAL